MLMTLSIIEMLGSSSELSYHRLPEDDPVQRRPDIDLAGIKLDWKPLVPLEEGLRKTISYFEDLIV